MMRTIYKDPDRYQVYWNTIPNCYTAGDVCRKDEDGYFWFMGRADDVIKVAGNRIGTAEVESALVSHRAVAEAAVIGKPHRRPASHQGLCHLEARLPGLENWCHS